MPEETATETETTETKTVELPPEVQAELAEGRAAKEKASRLEAELAEKEKPAAPQHPENGYHETMWTEDQWAAAEKQTGRGRAELLAQMNFNKNVDDKVRTTTGRLEARYETDKHLAARLAEEPLGPKMKKDAEKFLADIPEDMTRTKAGREKYVSLAVEFAKRGVKTDAKGRTAPAADVRETGRGVDKTADNPYTPEEKEAIERHGVKPEDYAKNLQHPYVRDGIQLKDRPAAPRFGPK